MSDKSAIQRFVDSKKIEFVVSSWFLEGENFGRFLRENGLSYVEIKTWREQMVLGLKDGKPMAADVRKSLENRVKLLEEENRQLKIVNDIQKKVQNLLELEEAKNTAKKLEKKLQRELKKGPTKVSVKKGSV